MNEFGMEKSGAALFLNHIEALRIKIFVALSLC